MLVVASTQASSVPVDAEAATHGDEAASVQQVKETEQKTPGFVFRQYNLAVLSHYSYKAGYPHKAVKDGDAIILGKVRAVIATTPGHTTDGTCLYVYYPATENTPNFVLTGDTLFIGSVGRPDLMGDDMSAAGLATL